MTKAIINGKMYNTETAECKASNIIYGPYGSYELQEELFCKKNGEYFIVRDFSGWNDEDNYEIYHWVLDHRVEPLSENKARIWCENNADVDTYIELFDEPEE